MIKLIKVKFSRPALLLLFFALFFCLSGCGGSKDETPTNPDTTPTAASINLSASPTSIKSDGSTTSTITVNALNSSNAALYGVTVTLSTDTGILSAESVVTDSTTPATVTLYCGGDKTNRTATITATAGTVTAQIPVQIVGSTVTLTSDASSISTTGSTNLTVTVKDAGGNAVSGTAVNLTQTGTGSVTFGATSGTTDINGKFTTTATGSNNGSVTITATALGATGTKALTITDAATVFAIDQQRICGTPYPAGCTVISGNPDPTAMQLNQTLEVRVNAPGTIANVVFATTGLFHDPAGVVTTGSVITLPVSGGKATAYLSTTQAGIATVQVYDAANSSTNDTLTVAMTSTNAYSITLQATPTVVPKSVGTTTGSSTLVAMVRDSGGFPVGNAPVSFSIVNPTGGGETISPVVVMTATTTAGGLNLGEARASFTSGSLPSGTTGVQIHAEVVGTTTVATGTALDGPDATIVIGGTAGSVAFGLAPELTYYNDAHTQYVQAMSVMVSNSNGNPAPAGTVVSLSLWPIAWSTGSNCSYDPDTATTGTFWNEDRNENLILDSSPLPAEDGWRCYYSDVTKGTCVAGGSTDGYITAVNSAAGSVPATVTTDANGVAGFNLTYPLSSSIWTVVRVRASTIVQGTETVGQIIFRLSPMCQDTPCGSTCKITGSPYNF